MITELDVHRLRVLESHLFFTRYFYKAINGQKFIVNDHHVTICDALDRVVRGEITRLIINICPRYSKTEVAVKAFIGKGLAHNAKAKFIHLTYAKNLALDNSQAAKELVESEQYQNLFPQVQIKEDTASKEKWYTTAGGGVYATAAGGQVTGFGAGKLDNPDDAQDPAKIESDEESFIAGLEEFLKDMEAAEGFGGAIIIDDPNKPDDVHSEIKRERVNERFENTIRNRVNSRNTPIIVIQQRVHEKDLSGYLMDVEPGKWMVLKIPALKADGTPLWPLKHTAEELLNIKRINPYVYASQYDQDPKPLKRGGEFYKLFNQERNTTENKIIQGMPYLYNAQLPLHISFDFNVKPYMTCTIWQIINLGHGKRAIQIDELCLKSPGNRTEAVCREFKKKYTGHSTGLFIYGDPSGKKEDTRTERGSNDFTIIVRELREFRPTLRVSEKAPPVKSRGDFINTIFEAGFDGIEIIIGNNCTNSVNDYLFGKEDSDGTKLKETATDTTTGVPYQKYHHCSDANDYLICFAFASSFAKYLKSGGGTGTTTIGKVPDSKNSY